ncbi:MAG: beta-lactamase family protein, partial [Treponema sp.]|nr:beta-lactamase family protein [Treponema sp.]
MDIKPFVAEIERRKLAVEGIIVFQRGADRAHYRWAAEQPRTIYSVSKGFISIAAGMAIGEGRIRLSDRVTRILERQSPDPRWDSLSLEHLLTMTMGTAKFARPQNVEEALSRRLVRDPGSRFAYDNTCTFLASAMLTKATGQKARDYLLDRLFRPLGMGDVEWQESHDDHTIGATGLMLTTSQMLLFGRFLLQRGNWEGRQLVPAAWIDAATRTQVPTSPPCRDPDWDLGYGYQFWSCRHGAYRLDGRDGQFLIMFPALDAVVAINSNEKELEPILWAV